MIDATCTDRDDVFLVRIRSSAHVNPPNDYPDTFELTTGGFFKEKHSYLSEQFAKIDWQRINSLEVGATWHKWNDSIIVTRVN